MLCIWVVDVVFSVCIRRCPYMGSVSVSSCICCMYVSCVLPVAVLNAAFCMTCSLLMLVEDARSDHMEEAYCRAGVNCLVGSHRVSPSVYPILLK